MIGNSPASPTSATCCPHPGGGERLDTFRQVVSVPNTSKTALAWSFGAFGDGQLWVALVTFLYLVSCVDSMGVLPTHDKQ